MTWIAVSPGMILNPLLLAVVLIFRTDFLRNNNPSFREVGTSKISCFQGSFCDDFLGRCFRDASANSVSSLTLAVSSTVMNSRQIPNMLFSYVSWGRHELRQELSRV